MCASQIYISQSWYYAMQARIQKNYIDVCQADLYITKLPERFVYHKVGTMHGKLESRRSTLMCASQIYIPQSWYYAWQARIQKIHIDVCQSDLYITK